MKAVVAAVLLSVQWAALAGPVETRQEIFKDFKKHMGAIKDIVKAADASQQSSLVEHARALAAVSDKQWSAIDAHFPEGSDQGDTDALPEIWNSFDDFKASAEKEQKAVLAFVDIAAQKDTAKWLSGFKSVGESCHACHENYRKDD